MRQFSLEALTVAAGIEPHYWDIHGRLHEISPDTARHLLKGLGLRSGTPAEIEASLAELTEENWRRELPPVIIVRHAANVCFDFIPQSDQDQRITWTVACETGDHSTGEFRTQNLNVVASQVVDGRQRRLFRIELPPQPLGYHRLTVHYGGSVVSAVVIVAPDRCHDLSEAHRSWGISAQLYGVRSQGDWGMGDFGSLGRIIDWTSRYGASTIGLNPLHALFLDAPNEASPYYPSSRLFVNPLYLDIPAMEDFPESEQARKLATDFERMGYRNGQPRLIDYPAVSAAKLSVLEELCRHFQLHHVENNDRRGQAFESFMEKGGLALRRFATFQLLSEQCGTHEWRKWPDLLHNPDSEAVNRIAGSERARLQFFQYLQWQCEVQLKAAADHAHSRGQGLCRDLAVGVAPSGSDCWCHQDMFLARSGIGAPPDPFNEAGQDWGLGALNPRALRAAGYLPFIGWLRANMRHASALRIDHIMGWQRLFVIPEGSGAANGAYLRFPIDDLLLITALESVRAKCSVIGEDLGTVPAGFRERIRKAGIFSTRILYFERETNRFRSPGELPELASFSVSNHDLATLKGFWTAADIDAKFDTGILKSPGERDAALASREADKSLLLEALKREALLPEGSEPGPCPWSMEIGEAIHVYLARSSCRMISVQLDDLGEEERQMNLPGTSNQYPNWRRRMERTLEELAADSDVTGILRRIDEARSK